MECQALAPISMAAELEDFLSRRQIPDPHAPILAGRSEAAAVRAECQPEDEAGMSGKPVKPFAGPCVPNIDEAIEIARGKAPAVGAERQRADMVTMFAKRMEGPACRRIPDPHDAIQVPRSQELPVRTERYAGRV